MCKETVRSLAEVPAGRSAAVVALQGGKEFLNRMASLGFTPGTRVLVVRNYRHGPIIALVHGTRIALGRGASLKVLVES
jgi:ferrous iron transport protein A